MDFDTLFALELIAFIGALWATGIGAVLAFVVGIVAAFRHRPVWPAIKMPFIVTVVLLFALLLFYLLPYLRD